MPETPNLPAGHPIEIEMTFRYPIQVVAEREFRPTHLFQVQVVSGVDNQKYDARDGEDRHDDPTTHRQEAYQ